MVQPNSRPNDERILPYQKEVGEEKPVFCPTGYPDGNVYGPVSVYNGFAVFLRLSAMHAQVYETRDLM